MIMRRSGVMQYPEEIFVVDGDSTFWFSRLVAGRRPLHDSGFRHGK
jgi:hypothetical protein